MSIENMQYNGGGDGVKICGCRLGAWNAYGQCTFCGGQMGAGGGATYRIVGGVPVPVNGGGAQAASHHDTYEQRAEKEARINMCEAKRQRKWDHRFLELAALIATWSKEPNTRVGCVIVGRNLQVVSTGFNGFPRGVKDSVERICDRETKLAMTLHAEDNALLSATRSLHGCTAYITHPPCSLCAAKLIQKGVKRVVYAKLTDRGFLTRWGKSMGLGQQMASEAKVQIQESDFVIPVVEVTTSKGGVGYGGGGVGE